MRMDYYLEVLFPIVNGFCVTNRLDNLLITGFEVELNKVMHVKCDIIIVLECLTNLRNRLRRTQRCRIRILAILHSHIRHILIDKHTIAIVYNSNQVVQFRLQIHTVHVPH